MIVYGMEVQNGRYVSPWIGISGALRGIGADGNESNRGIRRSLDVGYILFKSNDASDMPSTRRRLVLDEEGN